MATSLAIPASEFLALAPASAADVQMILRENLGANATISASDLDTVKVPAAAVTTWTIPGVRGERMEKQIFGVIVDWTEPRSFWPEKYDGVKRPPVCKSDDSITGVYSPEAAEGRYSGLALGGDCAQCPMSQWESDGGRGQACKATRELALLTPEGVMPILMSLPPTSIGPVHSYFLRLASGQISFRNVVTKFTLEKVSTGKVPDFSRVVPEWYRDLEPSEIAAARKYAADVIPGLRRAATAIRDAATATAA